MRKVIFILLFFTSISIYGSDFKRIDGWIRVGKIKTYNPENLWEYIDGAAELYLKYNFQELMLFNVKKNGFKVTISIYNMGTPLNAFGIYRSERPSNVKEVDAGTEAVAIPPYQLLLLKNRYYIKIEPYEGKITEVMGEELLKAVARSIPGDESYPAELQCLPKKNRIFGTEGFVKEAYLGLSELHDCLYADYQERDKNYQCFIFIPEAQRSVNVLWERLRKKWRLKKYKNKTILIKKLPYRGFVGIIMKGGRIIGVSNLLSETEIVKRLIMSE